MDPMFYRQLKEATLNSFWICILTKVKLAQSGPGQRPTPLRLERSVFDSATLRPFPGGAVGSPDRR